MTQATHGVKWEMPLAMKKVLNSDHKVKLCSVENVF